MRLPSSNWSEDHAGTRCEPTRLGEPFRCGVWEWGEGGWKLMMLDAVTF